MISQSPKGCRLAFGLGPSTLFIRRTDAEVEAPVLWAPDAKSWLIGKDPDAGKDWKQEEEGVTEDEMIHYQLSGLEFEFE